MICILHFSSAANHLHFYNDVNEQRQQSKCHLRPTTGRTNRTPYTRAHARAHAVRAHVLYCKCANLTGADYINNGRTRIRRTKVNCDEDSKAVAGRFSVDFGFLVPKVVLHDMVVGDMTEARTPALTATVAGRAH